MLPDPEKQKIDAQYEEYKVKLDKQREEYYKAHPEEVISSAASVNYD